MSLQLLNRIRTWQRDREVVEDLLSLSDHEPSVIGLLGMDVERAVKGGAHPQ